MGFTAKASTSTCPYGSNFMHLSPRNLSTPRAITAILLISVRTSVSIPHAVVSVGVGGASFPHPPRHIPRNQKGRAVALHRADGESTDGKRGNFPLLNPLICRISEFYISDVWKSVKFSKNRLYFFKKLSLNISLLQGLLYKDF